MKKIFLFIGLMYACSSFGQQDKHPNYQEFLVLDTLTHPFNKSFYELGIYVFETALSENEKNEHQHTEEPSHISGFLRAYENEDYQEIQLDFQEDLDLLTFGNQFSEQHLIIKNRYSFIVYDIDSKQISYRNTPGLNAYEGEDAISPSLTGFAFFDNQYLLGNIQAYGIFCYDISNIDQPVELKQYTYSQDNQGQYFVFFHQKSPELWDVIIANSDTASSHEHLYKYYLQFENVRYAFQDLDMELDQAFMPQVFFDTFSMMHLKTRDGNRKINLRTGQ